jgi:DNA-3-methyladenine glycosylase II
LNIVQYFLTNDEIEIDWESLSDKEIIKILTSIKGVGVWTVQMVLIFTLNRTDVWPTNDLGVQKGFIRLTGTVLTGKSLIKFMETESEAWIPQRSAVALLLWESMN